MALRRRRRLRGGYRSGAMKKSKKKIILRCLFVLACAILLTGISVLLGLYLKKQADSAVPEESVTESTAPAETEPPELYPDGIPSSSDANLLEICAADIDITLGSKESIYNRITALGDTYNGISVRIISEGTLAYVSPALLSYIGVPEDQITSVTAEEEPSDPEDTDEDAPDGGDLTPAANVFENLVAAAEAAKAMGLRLSAVYTAAPEVLTGDDLAISEIAKQKVIFGELLSLGFDEVIIDGLVSEEEDITHDKLRSMINYLGKLRAASGDLDLGVTLPSSVYMIHRTAGKIKTLSEYADFLAIGITSEGLTPDEAYSSVYESCYSLKGNFSVYNLRGFIMESDSDIAAAMFTSLKNLGLKSVQFTVYNESPEYDPNTFVDDAPAETEAYISNENALRAEDYAVTGPREDTP